MQDNNAYDEITSYTSNKRKEVKHPRCYQVFTEYPCYIIQAVMDNDIITEEGSYTLILW